MGHDPIPLIDLKAQYARLRPRIDQRLQAVLDHAGFVLGPEVGALEAELAQRGGVAHAVGVGSGTDALLLPLLAEGIGPGDAVFVPSLTFIATGGAVLMAGATPVFCDVDPHTFHLDVDDLVERAKRLPANLRPRAVIPVDLFGLPFDYASLSSFASSHGLLVLADAAQSFGGGRDEKPVGGLAPVTATSFYPTKPLGAFGDGGAILTDDEALAGELRKIRVHGQNQSGIAERLGLNSRLDTFQAAVLLAKLETFDADLRRRAEISARYDAALKGHVELQHRPTGAESTHAVYAILCDQRDRVREALSEQGIATRIYYESPMHLMPSMTRFNKDAKPIAVAESLSRRILSLPIYPEMVDAQVDRVSDAVITALEN